MSVPTDSNTVNVFYHLGNRWEPQNTAESLKLTPNSDTATGFCSGLNTWQNITKMEGDNSCCCFLQQQAWTQLTQSRIRGKPVGAYTWFVLKSDIKLSILGHDILIISHNPSSADPRKSIFHQNKYFTTSRHRVIWKKLQITTITKDTGRKHNHPKVPKGYSL